MKWLQRNPFERCDGQNYRLLAGEYKRENREMAQKTRPFSRLAIQPTGGTGGTTRASTAS
jgi:hypothetical protein